MPWLSLSFETPAARAEAVSDALLAQGAVSAEVRDAAAGTPDERPIFDEPGVPSGSTWERALVTALFESGADLEVIVAAASAEADIAPPPFSVEVIADQDWVRLTQSQFSPQQVSPRLWIVPTWAEAPDPGALNILLDPGLAFGTGSHPTTRLCLRWLDARVRGAEHVLDYGCGSGILAIAAMKLGAARASGTDIDPRAVEAARENAARNRVDARFSLPDQLAPIEADLVVANILANPLKVLAPLIAARTRPGGALALSGILADQAGEVVEAYRNWFDAEVAEAEDGWVLVTGTRRSAAG